MTNSPNFTDNKVASTKPELYACIQANVGEIIKSWRLSVFSYEWLTPDGAIKSADELSELERTKRYVVEDAINNGAPLEKPVLGIGMQDNVEIGSGRAVLLTLAAQGVETMPIHILKSNESDFKDFLASIE